MAACYWPRGDYELICQDVFDCLGPPIWYEATNFIARLFNSGRN